MAVKRCGHNQQITAINKKNSILSAVMLPHNDIRCSSHKQEIVKWGVIYPTKTDNNASQSGLKAFHGLWIQFLSVYFRLSFSPVWRSCDCSQSLLRTYVVHFFPHPIKAMDAQKTVLKTKWKASGKRTSSILLSVAPPSSERRWLWLRDEWVCHCQDAFTFIC